MNSKTIAGIGSRETPASITSLMEEVGAQLASLGYTLRTGNAQGADQAFARGVNRVDPTKLELYLPWYSYEKDTIVKGNKVISSPASYWFPIAEKHHPAWKKFTQGVQKLHARNIGIIGVPPEEVSLVICYLNHSKPGGGGTGQGVRYALSLGIPIIDLATGEGLTTIQTMMKADFKSTTNT